MQQTSKHTMKLNLGRIGLTLLLIYSTACASLKPFPTNEIIEFDSKHNVCGLYEITDPEKFTFAYVRDIPCPSVFGFSTKDTPKVFDWARDAVTFAKEHCN